MKVTLVFVLLFFGCYARQEGKWENLHATGDIPSNRSSPVFVHMQGRNHNREFYLFGGQYDPDGSTFTNLDDLYVYNAHTNAWTQLNPVGTKPGARVFHSGWQSSENTFTIIGGISFNNAFFDGLVLYNDIWEYNIDTNSWTQITDGTENLAPGLLAAAEIVNKGRYTYIFGGFNLFTFSSINTLFRYDNELKKLELPTISGSLPPARHFAQLIDIRNRPKFIVSSGPVIFSGIETSTYEFNTITNTYTQINPSNLPTPSREYLYGGTFPNGRFVCVGGDVPEGSAFSHNTLNETWSYNINKQEWEQLFPSGDVIPALKRHRVVLAKPSGQKEGLYMVAGFEGNVNTAGAQVWNADIWKYTRN